jgi:hypothetical protein
MTRWQFTGFDDDAAEYVDETTGEAYYHRPSWRTPMNDESKPPKKSTVVLAATMTPMQMIEQAIQGKADVAILERLMALQERWEANEAKKAFDMAIAKAKANMPEILKKAPANFGKFANLEEITKIITPILAKEGLSHRFASDTDGRNIIVTCIISHERGHREECSKLPGPPDLSGGKNAIQAVGSASTYLQRYTLLMALGLAPAKDDDGDTAGSAVTAAKPQSPLISDAQYDSLMSLLEAAAMPPNKVLERAQVDNLYELTEEQYRDLEAVLKERIRRKEKAAKPPSSTDVATAEAAYQMGREAQARGAGKSQWPGFWKDKQNIAEWQRGWSDAEDEMTSARAVDKETSRDND